MFLCAGKLLYSSIRSEYTSRRVLSKLSGDGLFISYPADDSAAAKLLFDTAAHVAEENSAEEMIGPVDCSFWLRYRLKTNRFGSPYTGEP